MKLTVNPQRYERKGKVEGYLAAIYQSACLISSTAGACGGGIHPTVHEEGGSEVEGHA